VVFDGFVEALVLFRCRQFAVQQQIADFKVVGMFRKLLDRVTAVKENAVGAIDIGDG
jgi:hypothetical protein